MFILAYILSPDGPSDRPTSPSSDAFFPNAIQQASHKDSDTKRNAKTKNNKNELTTIRQTKIVFFSASSSQRSSACLQHHCFLLHRSSSLSSLFHHFFPFSVVALLSPSCFTSSFSSLTLSPPSLSSLRHSSPPSRSLRRSSPPSRSLRRDLRPSSPPSTALRRRSPLSSTVLPPPPYCDSSSSEPRPMDSRHAEVTLCFFTALLRISSPPFCDSSSSEL